MTKKEIVLRDYANPMTPEKLAKKWEESEEDRILALTAENFDISKAIREYRKLCRERKNLGR